MGEKFIPFAPGFAAPAAAPAPAAPAVVPAAPAAEAAVTVFPTPKKAPIPGDYSYSLNEVLLEVSKLNVHYDSPILRDVDFTIRNIIRPGYTQGQVDALLAPSGMGKTQLFRCISGLKTPNSGSVMIGEGKEATRAGKVGVVAQDYPLFAHLTVFDNVLMAAKLKLDAKDAADKTISMLERFELDQRRDMYPHQLSGGQRQRVAIIQQMVACGHLLLMDEPFSGLDILMKEKVQDMITSLAAEDEMNSIILTTHDIQSAIAVADTILVMGRERDEKGQPIPGARIVKTFDLMERGLAWRPDVTKLPQFHELEREITAMFHDL